MDVELQPAISALDSSVEEIRYRAAQRLFAGKQLPEKEVLLRLLADASWRVRKFAVEKLLEQSIPTEVVRTLVGALAEQDNAGLRNAAAEVLARCGPAAVEPLLEVLATGGVDERKLAADILGEIGESAAVGGLLQRLDDDDENVRAAAIEALGGLGDRSLAPRLVEQMQRDGLMVRLSCLDALDRLGADAPLELLLDLLQTGPLRPMVYRLLGRARRQLVLPLLVKGLQARGRVERASAARALVEYALLTDQQGRVDVRVELARLGDELMNTLAGMLASSVREDREAAVMLLGWSGRERAAELLLPVAEDPALREQVREALLGLGQRVVGELEEKFDQASSNQKTLILEVLGQLQNASSVPRLLEAILDQDEDVTRAAQSALARVARVEVVETLTSFLQRNFATHADSLVGALVALGKSFQREVVQAMEPLLQQQQAQLRQAAAQVICALARLENQDQVMHLAADHDPAIRAAAVSALGRIGGGQASYERLRLALADEDNHVRLAAVRALAGRDDEGLLSLLVIALRDPDALVVREALVALGNTGDRSLGAHIRPLLSEDDGMVAGEAARALVKLKWDDDPSWLDEACQHPDAEVLREVLASCQGWPVEKVRFLVLAGLRHASWSVRVQAAKTVEALGDVECLHALKESVEKEDEDWVRETMQQILKRRLAAESKRP